MTEEQKKGKQTSPEKIVASNYIINFYQQVQNLNHWFSNYLNIDSQYSIKYQIKNPDGTLDEKRTQENYNRMPNEEKATINSVILELRYNAQNSYIHYRSLITTLNKKENEEITKGYEELKNKFYIDIKSFEKLLFSLNDFLLDEVVKDLLQSSQEIMQTLYTENEK